MVTMDPRIGNLPRGEVGISGSKIAYVHPSSPGSRDGGRPLPLPGRAQPQVIEASGMILIPGLVNAHCHAAMTLLRGYADDMTLQPWLEEKIWPVEARLTGEDVYWGTLLACVEMLKAGVTCFADMYFFMDDAARACVDAGIRASLSVGIVAGAPDGSLLPGAEAKLQAALDFCQRWNEAEGRITAMLGPHAPYTCPPEFLRDVIQAAERHDLAIHIHLSETALEVRRSRETTGKSPVRNMADLGMFERHVLAAHCVHVDAEDIRILAGIRGGVAHNPLSNLKLASGIAPVAEMLEAGVRVGIGTDGAASANSLGMFEEIRLAALLQKGRTGNPTVVPASTAMEMATMGGARVLGLQDRIGSITPGKEADLVLLDVNKARLTPFHDALSLLAYSVQDGDVHTVIVGGRLVVVGGRFIPVDEAEIRSRVQERAKLLVNG